MNLPLMKFSVTLEQFVRFCMEFARQIADNLGVI